MSDRRFSFDDPFYPVPASAIDADPVSTIQNLLFRVSRLEQTLEEQRVQAIADQQELLLELIAFSDSITGMIERWGVSASAREATLIRGLVMLGKRLLEVLKRQHVEALNTLGAPPDAETSDVVGSESHENVPDNVVVREVRVGYTWPHGILRRAQVVVNRAPGTQVAPDAPTAQDATAQDAALTDDLADEPNDSNPT